MNITNYNYYAPSFKANERTVKNQNGFVVHRNTTRMFRNDIEWNDFSSFLENHFKDAKKVNVYCFGCSDGSEPYSLVTSLKENSQNAEKFFPIHASDYDEEIIKIAKQGKYTLNNTEFDTMKRYTNDNWQKYFKMTDRMTFEPNEELKRNVDFHTENAITGMEKLQKGPKVIMIRNFLTYLSGEDKQKLLKNLAEVADKDTIIVTGAFDQQGIMLDRELVSSGYKPIEYTDGDDWSSFQPKVLWQKY